MLHQNARKQRVVRISQRRSPLTRSLRLACCLCVLPAGVLFGQPAGGKGKELPALPKRTTTRPTTTQEVPKTIPELVETANQAIANEDYRRAEVMLRRVLQQDPTYQDAVVGLSRVLRRQGHKIAALDELEQFLKTPQGLANWPAYVLSGELYFESGFLTLAKARFLRAENLNPSDANIQANLARTFQAIGKMEEALVHAKRAVEIDPNGISYQVTLGEVNIENQKFAQADRAARDALSLAEAQYKTRPQDLDRLQQLNDQLNFLQKTLSRHAQADPENADVLLEIARVIRRQTIITEGLRNHQALQYVVRADLLKPNNYEILLEKATFQRLIYNYEAALNTYQQVLAIHPTNEEAQRWIDAIKRRMGKTSATKPAPQPQEQNAPK